MHNKALVILWLIQCSHYGNNALTKRKNQPTDNFLRLAHSLTDYQINETFSTVAGLMYLKNERLITNQYGGMIGCFRTICLPILYRWKMVFVSMIRFCFISRIKTTLRKHINVTISIKRKTIWIFCGSCYEIVIYHMIYFMLPFFQGVHVCGCKYIFSFWTDKQSNRG